MGALFIGIPVKDIPGWYHINLLHVMMLHIFIHDLKVLPEFCSRRWRVCFWVSTIPAAILAAAMVFCAESPHWLYKVDAYSNIISS